MSEKNGRVLIIDDSPDSIHFLMESLKQDYAIIPATSGEKGLELAEKEPQPEVILLDVEMPEMDGYEVCRRLKDNPATQNIDVIFVSSHNSTDEKLLGYEAGGSDYVIKPIDPVELTRKVAVSIANKQKRAELQDEKDNIMSGFMEVLTSSGEQGVIIEFLRKSFTIDSIDELTRMLVESVSEYQLDSTVQIRAMGQKSHKSSIEPISPLEEELLSRLQDQGKILEHGKRMFINHGAVSLFIKALPDDETAIGRLRDNLVLLVEGANAKVNQIEMYYKDNTRRQGMQKLMDESQGELLELIEYQKEHLHTTISILDTLLQDLEESFLAWGLSEEQEQSLIGIVEGGINKALDHFESGEKADDRFKQLLEKFTQFTD